MSAPIEITAGALSGLRGRTFTITARRSASLGLTIRGLSEPAEKEARVRIRAALQTIRVDTTALAVELTVPDLAGAHPVGMDLPLCLAVLALLGTIPAPDARTIAIGDVSYAGSIRQVRGLLPLLTSLCAHVDRVFVPAAQCREAAESGIDGHGVENLGDVVYALTGHGLGTYGRPADYTARATDVDFADLRGLDAGVLAALESAATKGQSIALRGPHGAGATSIARRLATILPLPTREEALAFAEMRSVAGLLGTGSSGRPLLDEPRPFRAPHHTVSAAGLVGGGDPVRPGEVSLAHGGVLYLDEADEFRGNVLAALFDAYRQGESTIVLAGGRTTFPAKPLLMLHMPVCPCGFTPCKCAPELLASFTRRSEKLLARVDVVIDIAAPASGAIVAEAPRGESSEAIRARVTAAREASS